MAKKKITKKQNKEAKELAEKLKGKKGIDNPFALAKWKVKNKKKSNPNRKK